MTETCHVLLHRLGIEAELAYIKSYQQGAFEVFALSSVHKNDVYRLVKKYADLPMDLADASLVILAEHLSHGRILTTDERDFKTYRFKDHTPFENSLM